MGKTEAHAILKMLIPFTAEVKTSAETITLDFTGVDGVSPSGHALYFFGIFRHHDENILDQIVFENVTPEIMQVLESAVTDALDRRAQTNQPT